MKQPQSLDALFRPRSVAVIGASTKELSIGNRIIKNLQDFGFKGPIHPINPKGEDVRGIRSFKSILEVPGEVDLVHIVIPNKLVPQAIDDCGKKGVKVTIVNTAGFKEIGGDGTELEKLVMTKARAHGIRVFGPNCQGIINTDPEVRAYCNFTFTRPEAGTISIIAQSGGVGEVVNQRFSELGIGVRMYASNGNASDISIPEIIGYWGDDDKTRVIVVHIESLSNPKEFMEVAKEVAAKKPVLGMKTGRTNAGAKAVSSHTGGLAKVDIAAELMFKKCGMVTFRDEEEMCQAAMAFASQPAPKGKRVGMITNTGGPAIIAVDELIEAGLELPRLSEGCATALKAKLYPEASIDNPVDTLATGSAEHFRAALDALMCEENIDSVFINFVTPFFVDTESIAREIAEVNKAGKKPVVCNLMTDKRQWLETIRILREGGVPVYSFPETAARALIAMTKYGELKKRDIGQVKHFGDVDKEKGRRMVEQAKASSREFLSAEEVYSLLEAYRIPVAKWKLVNTGPEALEVAREIGFPIVLKVDSEKIIHKSDRGGVAANLTEEGARSAITEMEKIFRAERPRYLVQEYITGGLELIVGAKSEERLGHFVVFGLGGVQVELLKDVSFGLTPLTNFEAREMMTSVKSYPIIAGFRGKKGVDQEKLLEIVQRVSQLLGDLPEIKEMDLNPIIAGEEGARVVDARIRI